jgi:iron uptake system component EfeO
VPSLLASSALLAGCVSQSEADPAGGSSGKDGTVRITLSSDGCQPKPAKVHAGPVTFDVKNAGASRVTEAELLAGGRMLGEQENLSPGLSGGFSIHLEAGKYQIYCPGAGQEKWDFTVTGQSKSSWKDNPALVKATTQYGSWVQGEVSDLVAGTKKFAAAIKAGDMTQARKLYPAARVHYERVEPVAEIWGDLDRKIDGRSSDFAKPENFSGFHKLEQLMFAKHTLDGAQPVADTLVQNVQRLRKLVGKAAYQPAEIANGATALIDEIQRTKVTGEEEQYSHTDLVDFAGNLAGAKKAFEVLDPVLRKKAPDVATTARGRFSDVEQALAKYQADPGYLDTGYVEYTKVSKQQRRELSQKVNALGSELSKIAAKVA